MKNKIIFEKFLNMKRRIIYNSKKITIKLLSIFMILTSFGGSRIQTIIAEENSPASPFTIVDNRLIEFNKDLFAGEILEIPDGVIEIAEGVFQEKVGIKEVVLPSSLIKIGNYAFYKSGIEKINLSNVVEIGEHALQDNRLTEVDLSSLQTIGEYAFADNNINSVDFSNVLFTKTSLAMFKNNNIQVLNTGNLEIIGELSFAENDIYELINNKVNTIEYRGLANNNLTEVTFNAPITVGTNILDNNNRLVKFFTNNTALQSENNGENYGYIVNPITVVFHYINKENSEKILESETMGLDLSKYQFQINKEVTITPPSIPSFSPELEAITFTPDRDGYELTIKYNSVKFEPTLTIPEKSFMPGVDITKEMLLQGVVAEDYNGKSLIDRVIVSPETLRSEDPDVFDVTYSVEDDFGNTATKLVKVNVGVDWLKYELGEGWVVGDFEFRDNIVVGLSQQGARKISSNKNLVLPHVGDKGQEINVLDSYHFRGKGLQFIKIPDNYVKINIEKTFENNEIKEIVIPSQLKAIPRGTFINNKIVSITFQPNSKLERIEDEAFSKNKITGKLELPNTVKYVSGFDRNLITEYEIGNNVEEIGRRAFYDNKIENKIFIPSNVIKIGESAYEKNLIPKVEFDSNSQITKVLPFTFKNNKIYSLILSSNITDIGQESFKENLLASFELSPEYKVKTIGREAFKDNVLKKVVVNTEHLTRIENEAFSGDVSYGRPSGNSIIYLEFLETLEYFGEKSFASNRIANPLVFGPKSVIMNQAFNNNRSIKNVTFKNGTKKIGKYAFATNIIEDLVVPGSVKTIEQGSFGNNNLKSLTIEDGVEHIESYAFIYMQDILDGYSGGLKYHMAWYGYSLPGIHAENIGNSIHIQEVRLPNTLKTVGVMAFRGALDVNELVIPSSVTRIEKGAFMDNSFGEKLEIKGNNLKEIPDDAFLRTKYLYSNESNNKGQDTSDILAKSIVIGNGVEIIGKRAFGYSKASSLSLPNTLKEVKDKSFFALNMNEVSVPNTLSKIANDSFSTLEHANMHISDDTTINLVYPNRDNPYSLSNSSKENTPYWAINHKKLVVSYQSNDGSKLLEDVIYNFSEVELPKPIDFPNVFGYITPNSFSYDGSVETYTAVYVKIEDEDSLNNSQSKYNFSYVNKRGDNVLENSYDNRIPTVAKFNLTPDASNFENVYLELKYDFDQFDVEVKDASFIQKKEISKVNGVTKVYFKTLSPSQQYSVDINFKPKRTTIYGEFFEIKGQLKHNNTNLTKQSIVNTGYRKSQDTELGVSILPKGKTKTYLWSYQFSKLITNDKVVLDVPENFIDVGFYPSYSKFEVKNYKIKFKFKKYKTPTGETLPVVDLSENKGWSLEDGFYVYTSKGLENPNLRFRVPNMNVNQEFSFEQGELTVYTYKQGTYSGRFRRGFLVQKDISNVDELLKINKNVEFGFREEDKSRIITLPSIGVNSLVDIKDMNITFKNLDKRMMFQKIRVPDPYTFGEVFYFSESGDLIKHEVKNGDILIPENIRKDVAEIHYRVKDVYFNNNYVSYFNVDTLLKTPNDLSYDFENIENNEFTLDVYVENISKMDEIRAKSGKATALLVSPNYELEAVEFYNEFEIGKDVDVQFGIRVPSVWKSDLENFEAVVLLPKGFTLIDINPPYAIADNIDELNIIKQENYKGSGRTLVRFSKQNIKTSNFIFHMTFMRLKLGAPVDIEVGTPNNIDFYYTFSNPEIEYKNTINDSEFFPNTKQGHTNKIVVQAREKKQDNPEKTSFEILGRRIGEENWHHGKMNIFDGVNYEYKVVVKNNSDKAISNVKVTQLLGYVNDRSIIKNIYGDKTRPRSSFDSDLDLEKEIITPEGVTVKYYNNPVLDTDTMQDYNFEDTPTEITKYLLFEVNQIGANETLEFVVPMKAETNENYINSFKKSYTSSAIFYENEGKKVENETNVFETEIMPPLGSLTFKNVNQAGERLSYAKYAIIKDGVTKDYGSFDIMGSATVENLPLDNYRIVIAQNKSGYTTLEQDFKTITKEEWEQHGTSTPYDLGDIVSRREIGMISPFKSEIRFRKVDIDNKPLRSVGFIIEGISPHNSSIVKESWSDGKGMVIFKDLTYGTYRITEMRNWALQPVEPFEVKITQFNEIKVLDDIRNEKINFEIMGMSVLEDVMSKQITKLSNIDGIKLKNQTFSIAKFNTPDVVLQTISTGENGVGLFKDLEPDTLYIIKQVETPENHNPNTEAIIVKASKNGKVVENDKGIHYNSSKLYFRNQKTEKNSILQVFVQNHQKQPLPNSQITLYKQDGETWNVVKSESADEAGIVSFDNLREGTYKFVQTSSVNGYYPNKKEEIFVVKTFESKTFKYNLVNKDLKVEIHNFEILESNLSLIKANVLANKYQNAKVIKQGSGVYSVIIPIPNTSYQVLKENEVVEVVTTNEHGVATVLSKLDPNQIYKVQEVEANNKYHRNLKPYYMNLNTFASTQPDVINPTFISKLKLGKITVTNFDEETGVRLPNIEWSISQGSKEIKRVTSNDAGVVNFNDITLGEYTITQISTLKGYEMLNPISYTINVVEDNPIIQKTYYHKKGNFFIEITKVNKEGERLDGVEFTLYNEYKNEILTKTTENGGIVRFEDLAKGLYYVKETKALNGYMLSLKTYRVDFNDENVVNVFEIINEKSFDLPITGKQDYIYYSIVLLTLLGLSLILNKKGKKV